MNNESMKTQIKDNLRNHRTVLQWITTTYTLGKNIVRLITVYIGSLVFFCLDSLISKNKSVWLFPVHFYMHTFSDNSRAVFEEIKGDPSIVKVILVRERPIDIEPSTNIIVLKMYSLKGLWFLLKSGVVFVQHSVYLDFLHQKFNFYPLLNFYRRLIVNLWHGTTIKSLASESTGIHIKQINREKNYYRLVSSSKIDRLAMAVSFSPSSLDRVWVTGLPRNDFLKKPEHLLPQYCQEQLKTIREKRGKRRLIIYAPTYREIKLGGVYYVFSDSEIFRLRELLETHNAILGIRMHYYNRRDEAKIVDDVNIIELDNVEIPDMGLIIRESDLIISDYSSVLVEALYFPKRVISFSYDLEHYKEVQRGIFYSLNQIIPEPLCKTFDELLLAIEKSFEILTELENQRYEFSRKTFFDFFDDNNGRRVVDKVKKELAL
jgi:CDP-glycerol glycerophosphotransferase (TagB/SpsB family)